MFTVPLIDASVANQSVKSLFIFLRILFCAILRKKSLNSALVSPSPSAYTSPPLFRKSSKTSGKSLPNKESTSSFTSLVTSITTSLTSVSTNFLITKTSSAWSSNVLTTEVSSLCFTPKIKPTGAFNACV